MSTIERLKIIDDQDNIIFSQDKYIIPLYQRAFAWTEKEIGQLIEDIYDFEAEHYYLGSLIVNLNKDGKYEVIDGQQRLTALFLLLNYLGYHWDADKLCYECREKSNYTLNNLTTLSTDNNIEAKFTNSDKIEQSLINGIEIIKDKFNTKNIDRNSFIKQLGKVLLFRIEVPPHTDLNRYFEIMNVRGEQLEQHDILKAKLMAPLNETERVAFAIVWDACRDMTGYVQMHFSKNNRELLFDNHWDFLKVDEIFSLQTKNNTTHSQNAIEIIENNQILKTNDGEDEDGNRVRFDSIIEFPYFLLHVLKVFIEEDKNNISIPLDDKKLVQTFDIEIDKNQNSKQFSMNFIKCLLECRFLFDKYIIKREYKNENSDGEWSLKELKVSGAKSKKKPYYKDTSFGEYKERETTSIRRAKSNLMLQSCLRVSYTSPKVMHWITELLKWLYNDDNLTKLSQFECQIENINKEPVSEFLNKGDFKQGVNTPHIVLNYLDYLLWKRDNADFVFEFRNSVEHWYPQHPFNEDFKMWEEVDNSTTYDRFGNLCLLQRDTNAKFSNASPISKKGYETQIKKGSLKLREMSKKTTDNSKWITEDCGKHEQEMLKLLRDACNIE